MKYRRENRKADKYVGRDVYLQIRYSAVAEFLLSSGKFQTARCYGRGEAGSDRSPADSAGDRRKVRREVRERYLRTGKAHEIDPQ